MAYKRLLNFKLPKGQSAFLWGARKTGKTTYLKNKYPKSIFFDFLKTDLYLDFIRKPFLLRERLLAMGKKALAHPVILDEVQKVPQILDEVQWLIENKKISFILCGSSARKLKRGGANLLGGRAWRFEMRPLVYKEITDFNLLKALNQGAIPDHYLQNEKSSRKSLQAYTQDYLKEEIFAEGLVRNIPAFTRFFDVLTYSHGEMINYANIARDCSVDAKTIKAYFQILEDTLLATLIDPFKKRQNRQVISKAPKFYLFDTGVAGFLCKRLLAEPRGAAFGKAFEHFIFNEINAYRAYSDKGFQINYWRTKTGLEVDFVLGRGEVAVEVKTGGIDARETKGLRAFIEEYAPKKALIVCTEKYERVSGKIRVMPWQVFLSKLWDGKII